MNLCIPSIALVRRELLTTLRRGRTFALLTIAVAMTGGTAVFLFVQQIGASPSILATQQFFSNYVLALFAVSFLLVPPLAAISVCGEKQQQTFDLLATTLIRPSGILFAKFVNVVGVYLLIVVATLPVAGVIFFFVGLDWSQFGISVLMLVISTATFASAGLFASTRFRRPLAAMAFTYAAVFVFAMLLPSAVNWLPPAGVPVAVMASVYYVSLSPIFLFLALRALCRPPKPEKVERRKPIDDPAQLRQRRQQFPYYLIDPLRRRKSIADGQNPMRVKEEYTGLFNRGTMRVRAFYVYLIFCVAFTVRILLGGYSSRQGFAPVIGETLLYQTVPLLFVGPVLVAATLAREYELGNIDMIRMTLLTPREIVLGKLYSVAPTLLPMLLASALCMTPAFLALGRAPGTVEALFTGCVTMLVSLALVLALALRMGLECQRTPTALVAAYLANLLLFLAIPGGVVMLLTWLTDNRYLELYFVETPLVKSLLCLVPSPVAVQWYNLDRFFEETPFNAYWCLNMCVSVLWCFGLTLWSVRVFARDKMRER